MNYQQTISYLFGQLPMYQRIGQAAYKVNLDNTHKLCKILGNPEQKLKTVHVAGTNGKGSTSHMIASVLQEAGYKVGLYTSPHLKDFKERIKINGQMITEDAVVHFVSNYKHKFEKIHLSFFEWTVGLAFSYFESQDVDIAVVETGLGGRLDSTNVLLPELSLITNIGLDHTQFLGATLPKIAIEKAGIIKEGVPVVIGERQEEIVSLFTDRSLELNAPIVFADETIQDEYLTDLKGRYQKKNVKNAVKAIQILQDKNWKIDKKHLVDGLQNVINNTGLLGRWQTLGEQPKIICDVGHNETGIKEIVQQINELTFRQLHFVLGTVNDKSIETILQLLPKGASYYFCEANIPRALPVEELHRLATKNQLEGISYNSVSEALVTAKQQAEKEDLIFIGGSTFVVAEVI